MRRPLASVGAAALTLLLVIQPAGADEEITSGAWAGSSLDDGPTRVEVGSYLLEGDFRRSSVNRDIEVTLSVEAELEDACDIVPIILPVDQTPTPFSEVLSIPCNGTYRLIATANTVNNNAVLPPESAELDRIDVKVVAPAPPVSGFEMDARRRIIDLRWNDMRGAAPDLTGYSVQRKINGGSFAELERVGVGVQSYQDDSLPVQGGTATYRVLAARPSPEGERLSPSATERSTSFPSGSTGGGTGGSTGGGSGSTGGSGGSGGSTGSGGTGGSGGTTAGTGGTGSGGVRSPRLFAGTFLPPLLRPASETLGTTTTVDPGFSGVLPYDPRNPGRAATPEGSLDSLGEAEAPRRGMLIPVATALVLATWAFHLRVLARASRPVS